MVVQKMKLGGYGHTVEIDESKFGRRKHHQLFYDRSFFRYLLNILADYVRLNRNFFDKLGIRPINTQL